MVSQHLSILVSWELDSHIKEEVFKNWDKFCTDISNILEFAFELD